MSNAPSQQSMTRSAESIFWSTMPELASNALIVDLALEDWDRVIRTNLYGPFLSTQQAARRMIEQGRGGRIINITVRPRRSVQLDRECLQRVQSRVAQPYPNGRRRTWRVRHHSQCDRTRDDPDPHERSSNARQGIPRRSRTANRRETGRCSSGYRQHGALPRFRRGFVFNRKHPLCRRRLDAHLPASLELSRYHIPSLTPVSHRNRTRVCAHIYSPGSSVGDSLGLERRINRYRFGIRSIRKWVFRTLAQSRSAAVQVFRWPG